MSQQSTTEYDDLIKRIISTRMQVRVFRNAIEILSKETNATVEEVLQQIDDACRKSLQKTLKTSTGDFYTGETQQDIDGFIKELIDIKLM